MKYLFSCLTCLALMATSAAAEPIRIVTTIPDLANFARKVGGSRVEVYCMSSGQDDPHNVMIKPSMVTKLAEADLFIEMGLDLEHSYAPAVLTESRNMNIQVNQPGYLDCSTAISVREVPQSLDRAEGDQHSAGNPHYNLDPMRMQKVVQLIAEKLSELRPESRLPFDANARAYNEQLDAKMKEWTAKLAGRKIKFVSYHPAWVYFAECFGLQHIGTIQPKPGVEPGPRHIEELVRLMKSENVKLILKESFYSDRFPQEIATRTGARVASVPIMVGGTPQAADYIHMIDQLVTACAGD